MKLLLIHITILLSFFQFTHAQQVEYTGGMHIINKERKTYATVLVDTLPQKHLYGIGPVENLQGEILVWDGKPFVAAITTDSKKPMLLKNVHPLKAIFFVYAQVPAWDTFKLHTAPQNMQQLQSSIGSTAAAAGFDTTIPFPFLLYGKIAAGKGHIMYMDTTQKVLTTEVQKAANHSYSFAAVKGQMLGFYSQHHQSVFTHKDSYLHIHFRLNTKYQAGHLDAVAFDDKEPVLLYLPANKKQ